MSKKTKVVIVIVLLLIFGGIYLHKISNSTPDFSVAQELYFTAVENSTVYDFMNRLQNEGKINFTEKTYAGMGKFITSINGIEGNSNQNWIYYINNQKAEVGVSNYKIKPGDVVSWKYEKFNY